MIRVLLVVMVSLNALARVDACVPAPRFIRGDVDVDGQVLINDAIFSLGVLFQPGGGFPCEESADVNDDGSLNIGDPVFLLSYLFSAGPEIPAPFPDCGIDLLGFAFDCFEAPAECAPPEVFYVLDAPSRIGAGNDSLIQVSVNADGTEEFVPFLPGDGTWNGLRHLEVTLGSIIAVQEDATLGTSRLILLDGTGGTTLEEGITGEVVGLASDGFQFVYLLIADAAPSIRLVRVEPFASDPSEVLWSIPGDFEVRGFAVDDLEYTYFAASTPSGSATYSVDMDGNLSTLFGLPTLDRAHFDEVSYLFTTVDTVPSGGYVLRQYSLLGEVIAEVSMDGPGVDPPGEFIASFEEAVIPIPEAGQIRLVRYGSGALGVWDQDDGLSYPVEVAGSRSFTLP